MKKKNWLWKYALKIGLVSAILGASAGWWLWARQTSEHLRKGETALAARDYAEARDHIRRYLAVRPGDSHARLLAARAARHLREYFEAQEHLDAATKVGGNHEAIKVESALLRVQRGDEEPIPLLRDRTQEKDELALVILEVLIQHDIDTYQLRQALQGLNAYLEQKPNDLHALLSRAFVRERELSFRDALNDYQKAVVAHPNNEQARLRLAETHLICGTPDDALKEFRWLEQRTPSAAKVRFGIARCQMRLGETDAARNMLDELVAEFPQHGEVLWERGQVALEMDRPREAETFLRKGTRLLPFDRRVHYALYQCLLRLDRREEAEEVNARIAQLDADLRKLEQVRKNMLIRPDDASLRYEGGMLFLRNGEKQEGIRWLRRALRMDPNHQQAQEALVAAEARGSQEGKSIPGSP